MIDAWGFAYYNPTFSYFFQLLQVNFTKVYIFFTIFPTFSYLFGLDILYSLAK